MGNEMKYRVGGEQEEEEVLIKRGKMPLRSILWTTSRIHSPYPQAKAANPRTPWKMRTRGAIGNRMLCGAIGQLRKPLLCGRGKCTANFKASVLHRRTMSCQDRSRRRIPVHIHKGAVSSLHRCETPRSLLLATVDWWVPALTPYDFCLAVTEPWERPEGGLAKGLRHRCDPGPQGSLSRGRRWCYRSCFSSLCGQHWLSS